jgi:hypothetical protein
MHFDVMQNGVSTEADIEIADLDEAHDAPPS